MTFNDHITLYAVWAYDKNSNGIADYREADRPDAAQVLGKTAHSVTVEVKQGQDYSIDGTNWYTPTQDGIYTFTDLSKDTDYTVLTRDSGNSDPVNQVSTAVRTSAVDAEDIARVFADDNETTTHDPATTTRSGGTIVWEKAENDHVIVTVDPETGNYIVELKKDVDGTVDIPDTWGDVILDLNGNDIKGDDGTESDPNGKPGIVIADQDPAGTGEDTRLEIRGPGTVTGGDGYDDPDGNGGNGGDGIAIEASNSRVDTGRDVTVTGGDGGDGGDGDGGNGGTGVRGNVGTNDGTITGGDGGNGDNGGDGGDGGTGVRGNVGTNNGTITGGDGGDGDNGGDGGNGGTGVDGSVATDSGTITNGTRGEEGRTSDPGYPGYIVPGNPSTVPGHVHDENCDGKKENGCPADMFVDVDTSQWYHEALDYVLDEKLMNGVAEDRFAPNGTTSRAMIITILWRMEGMPVVDCALAYEDVPVSEWYTEAVRWGKWTGIMEGYGDDLFGPEDAITREQMAAVLYRYARYKGIDVSVLDEEAIYDFTDARSVSDWAVEAMGWVVENQLMHGDGVKLTPTAESTRCQCAALLMRFAERIL